MASWEGILTGAGAIRSRAIDYLLGTVDDRQVPPVVAHKWPSDSPTVRFRGSECQAPSWWPTRAFRCTSRVAPCKTYLIQVPAAAASTGHQPSTTSYW